MSDGRDPAIKLFGMEIPLPEEKMFAEEGEIDDFAVTIELQLKREKDTFKETSNNNEVMVETEEITSSSSSSSNNSTKKTSTETTKSIKEPNFGHDHKESNTSVEDKTLKKPDKVLPCPRCDSSDTKFCYYNNYNVNQPRHFCKNCQRYWTAGGTMRNVPIGAGRRKNKQSAPNFRHTFVSTDALPSVLSDGHGVTSIAPMTSLKGNNTILKFGPDASEYMASTVNLSEKKMMSDSGTENREEPSSCSSSVTASNPEENCLPWPNWPYPWNPGCIPVQESGIVQSQILAVPIFCAPTFPFPFVPAPFWGWNMSWAGPGNGVSPPSSSTIAGNFSGNGSPTLGKHSREDEKSLWIPKTLRIDDPDEAAKRSIFATLGIKLDECGNFNTLQSNTGRGDALKLLRSNPAALSRSQSFQETA